LAYRPFSPWRQGDELTLEDRLRIENRPPSKLDDIGWNADAELYRVLLKVGITPPTADEMELWQLGAVLGAHEARAEGIDPELWERERDSLAGRAAAIRGAEIMERRRAEGIGRPTEETDITAQVMAAMKINTG
jgi:hypothetical protein